MADGSKDACGIEGCLAGLGTVTSTECCREDMEEEGGGWSSDPIGRVDADVEADKASISSLSDCARRICGLSETTLLTESPEVLVLPMIRFPALDTASKPAATSRWFAFSRSARSRSLSEAMSADCARCFSISFHSWLFWDC